MSQMVESISTKEQFFSYLFQRGKKKKKKT